MPNTKSTVSKKYYETDHGPEIFPRRLILTPEEHQWRKEAEVFLREHVYYNPPASLPAVGVLREQQAIYQVHSAPSKKEKYEAKRERNRDLSRILLTLRVVNEILKVQYGSPDWGNQPHVIGELVYILLTRRSKIKDAKKHFKAIREKYTTWEDVAHASPDELKTVIMGGGLEDDKVKFIQGALQSIYKKFNRIDEADFINMPDEELNKFLCTLRGIGKKSVDCILMYVRQADIFPVDTHCMRVIDRLGLFKGFGFDWSQANHKQAEQELPLLIPPHIRNDLHRNLLALGQEICKPSPQCHLCEIRKFCNYYRQQQQKQYNDSKAPLAIELFCGAGGFSQGLHQAGFKIVAAIDNNPDAIRTYRLNHPDMPEEAVIEGDARKVDLAKLRLLLGKRGLDLLVGGPPCQGFSMMGNRVPHKFENGNKKFGADYKFSEDERNHLFEALIDVAKGLQPRYVVIENVPGLGSANIKKEKSFAEHIAESLEKLDYEVEIILLEAVNLFIPQRRHRYFIFGVRKGERKPDFEKLKRTIEQITPLKYALYDLPELSTSDGRWITAYSDKRASNAEWNRRYLEPFKIKGNTTILFNHVSRFNNPDDTELYANLKQGETYQQLVARLVAEQGRKPDFIKYSTENFEDKYYRLEWEGQSKTIVSHLYKDGNSFVHPLQNRSLSVREAARIQSFPDDYIFCGSRGAQFIQIGNAVPPVMAEAIGRVFIETFGREKTYDRENPHSNKSDTRNSRAS